MSRNILLRAMSSLHLEVFEHFSKNFRGKLHTDQFFKRLEKVIKLYLIIFLFF